MNVSGKRIVIGVSGGIAAYKAVDLVRHLVDAGAHVIPIMTEDAHRFIGEVTLSALASEPVHKSLWSDTSAIPHTRMGQTADLIVVAPATARVISAYATGSSEDLLTATLIATRAPVIICPAMHTEMWEHPAVQDNISTLRSRGVVIVDPEDGRLAGGDIGRGRLASTENIVSAITATLDTPGHTFSSTSSAGAHNAASTDMSGMHVVVTAGGTREPIDAVRVIANRSSGKQGYAIAEVAAARGARVTLVSTVERGVSSGVTVLCVETAEQMRDAVIRLLPDTDALIMAAAVADFRPKVVASSKLKKHEGVPEIVLVPTADILEEVAAVRRPDQVVVGFAAETDNVVENARLKITQKSLDFIVANDVSAPGVGFSHDTNAVTMVFPQGAENVVPLNDKHTIASAILDSVVKIHREKR
jgi:phosphopantothenoylcysteine decarboxylase/phosphopantothenate--cysteine ligase